MSKEKNIEKKGRFNIIDLVLILSILVVIAAAVYGTLSALGTNGETKTLRYTVEVSEIRNDFVTKVSDKDSVYDYDTGELIGKVVSVSSNPAKHTGTDSSGALVTSEIDGFRTLYLTVETKAEISESGFRTGGFEFTVGTAMKLRLPNIYLEGVCIDTEISE